MLMLWKLNTELLVYNTVDAILEDVAFHFNCTIQGLSMLHAANVKNLKDFCGFRLF